MPVEIPFDKMPEICNSLATLIREGRRDDQPEKETEWAAQE
jgi:hypothetical protein